MSLFNGKKIKIEIFGESHSNFIGAKVYNFPKMKIDLKKLYAFIARRKASNGVFSTSRIEDDLPKFEGLNGENENEINGDFSFTIQNKNVKSCDYDNLYGKPRPSHADYTWFIKDGQLDFAGGGRFSGRLTACLCVIGGISLQYLSQFGIEISAYISKIGNVDGASYKNQKLSNSQIIKLRESGFPSLSNKDEMLDEIETAKVKKDSVGGKIDCVVSNIKAGIGDNLFEGLEGKISSLLYSIPAVKGVEFGLGFEFASEFASNVNDELYFNNGKVDFFSNNNGGILGGISNGNQITMSVAIKPTPSIGKTQKTIDLVNKTNTEIEINGRHDSCIVVRAVPCVESAVAIALLDEIIVSEKVKGLSSLREKIDKLDKEIVNNYIERIKTCREIALIKAKENKQVFDKKREEEVINKITKDIPNEYKNQVIELYNSIFTCSKKYQEEVIKNK